MEDFGPNWADLGPLEWVEIPETCNGKVSGQIYSHCYQCTLSHPASATSILRPETYAIQPQGHCLHQIAENNDLSRMTHDIDGAWVEGSAGRIDVTAPAMAARIAEHTLADAADVNRAVQTVRRVHLSGALTAMRPIERGRMDRRWTGTCWSIKT